MTLMLTACATTLTDGKDHKRSRDFVATLEHSFPDGDGVSRVENLLRENGFFYEWRSGEPFNMGGEYIFARRNRKSRQYGMYVYEAGFRFENDELVERQSQVLFKSSRTTTPIGGSSEYR